MAVQASPPRRTTRRTAETTQRAPARGGSGTASRPAGTGRRVATTSAGAGRRVADPATDESVAGRVKDTVRVQAAQVRDEIATHGRTVVEEVRTKAQEESYTQARRAGEGLSRLASEAHALAEGRPGDAETLRGYLMQGADRLMEAADRFYGLADEIDERGIEGVASDLQRFARRRPGVFLLGAAVAGFGVGRAVRSAQSDEGDEAWEEYDDEVEYEGAGRRAVASRRALAGASGTTATGGTR
jgi:hypothetical protein